MERVYTSEEVAEMIMNCSDNESSCDSFDADDSDEDSAEVSSKSENDSDSDKDFCGRKISPEIGRKRTRGGIARGIPRYQSGQTV